MAYSSSSSSKKSVFCKLDMMRLLFCVLTNVLSSVCIICVYHVIINYFICVGSCLTIIFTFKYGIVHFKYFSGAIFCE